MDLSTLPVALSCLAAGGLTGALLHPLRASSSQAKGVARLPHQSEAASEAFSVASVPLEAVTVALATDAGPFAEIRRLTPWASTKEEELELDDRLRTGLQALLQHAPTLLHETASVAARTYVVRFDPEVARKLADGTLTMMQAVNGGLRATAVDASGRIAGNAVLSPPSHSLTGALVVWQVLAVVTAQKFLADIDARLAGIERGIAELKSWMEDEQYGNLDGSLRYMRTMAESLRQRDLTEDDIRMFGDQLEIIGREAQSFMAMRERQLARAEEALPNIKLTGIGFEENSAAASRLVQEFQQACAPWWLAARVRGIACQLRAPLPLSRETSRLRARELREEMREHDSKRARFVELANRRLPELRGEFTFDETDARHQERLRQELSELDVRLSAHAKELLEAADLLERQLSNLLDASAPPLELRVTLDTAGVPSRAARLLHKSA